MATRASAADSGNPFAKRLRAAIAASDFSHRGLAAEIGASKQSVTNWTQGYSEPSLENLRRVADALGVDPASLLDEKWPSEPHRLVQATELLRELTALRVRPAAKSLASSAPSLLDLLERAERLVQDVDGGSSAGG